MSDFEKKTTDEYISRIDQGDECERSMYGMSARVRACVYVCVRQRERERERERDMFGREW